MNLSRYHQIADNNNTATTLLISIFWYRFDFLYEFLLFSLLEHSFQNMFSKLLFMILNI